MKKNYTKITICCKCAEVIKKRSVKNEVCYSCAVTN